MILEKTYFYIRRTLCWFNLTFWIYGCCLIGIGTWLSISDYKYFRILPSYHFLSADNLILFFGITAAFIAFLGCCGSWFESKFLLHFYLIIILVIMVLEILTGSLGFFYRQHIYKKLENELYSGLKNNYTKNLHQTNGIKYAWDYVQNNFKCCGVLNYTDWYNIAAWPGQNKLPGSCCTSTRNHTVVYNPSKIEKERIYCNIIYKKGCFEQINYWLLENLYIVAITFIVFAFVQFFVFLSSILMIFTITKKSNYSVQNIPTYSRVSTLD